MVCVTLDIYRAVLYDSIMVNKRTRRREVESKKLVSRVEQLLSQVENEKARAHILRMAIRESNMTGNRLSDAVRSGIRDYNGDRHLEQWYD